VTPKLASSAWMHPHPDPSASVHARSYPRRPDRRKSVATYLMPVFAVIAVACAAGIVFVVAIVHKYPSWPGDDDRPEVPEDSPARTRTG